MFRYTDQGLACSKWEKKRTCTSTIALARLAALIGAVVVAVAARTVLCTARGGVRTREAYDIGRQSDNECWVRTVDTVKLLVVVGVKASDTACLATAACMCVTCAGSTWVLLGGVLCRNAPGQITPWRLGQAWQHKYGKARNTPEQKPVPYRSHISHWGVAQSWSSWQHCPPANVTALVVIFSCQISQIDMQNHANNVQ